jgi:hypothetical protein
METASSLAQTVIMSSRAKTDSFGKTLLGYWANSLRESLRRDRPRGYQIAVTEQHLRDGRLTEIDAHQLQDAWARSRAGRQKARQHQKSKTEHSSISVLVAPYLAGPVGPRTRAPLAEALPPFWVPAILQNNGTLLPDPEHLPFVPRALLDPPLSQRSQDRIDSVADLRDYDAVIRAMTIDREEGWQARLNHAEEMFVSVHGRPASGWLPPGWQRQKPIVAVWDTESGFTRPVLHLIDEWLSIGTMPGCLALAGEGRPGDPIDPSVEHRPQLGHAGGTALNVKQRDAVRAVGSLVDGQVQAVNGPPGTGKTSLLRSIVADAVVRAAVDDSPPPVIMLTSTNNQAVRTAAAELKVDSGKNAPLLRRRWLPDLLPQLAVYDASRQAAESAGEMMLLDPIMKCVFAFDYTERASNEFLRNYAAWREGVAEKAVELSVDAARRTLGEKLRDTVEKIRARDTQAALACRYLREGKVAAEMAAAAEAVMGQAQADAQRLTLTAEELDARAEAIRGEQQHALEMLRKRAGLHPLWMRLCSPLKSVESQRACLLHRAAVTLGYLGADAIVPTSRTAVQDAVDAAFVARIIALRSEAASIRAAARIRQETATAAQSEADRTRADLSTWAAADAEVRAWMTNWSDAHATDHVDAMQRRLDLEQRALAFDLAMRLREAEFLARAKEWNSGWAQGKRTKTKDLRVSLLRAIALLTPCVVCTVYKGATYGCYFDSQTDRPLSLPIDLLIYDEAGQVLPDRGLPLLGFARRAVAVGDIHQLEPIIDFSDEADTALMCVAGADRAECDKLREMGLDHASGSVMRLFQVVTAYSEDQALLPGIMLRHHFRCVPRVIAYCNELVYRNQLVPLRPPAEAPSVPPMAWAHLRGDSQKAGRSWTNPPEAEAIARWIAGRRSAIESEHGACIEDLVAVITPYRAQRRVLQTALSRHIGSSAKGMIVDTVHALQGAQQRIVVFSPTITWASVVATGIRPFFDLSSNMLNVAVSRAQDAFVVIGDMALFDAHPSAGSTPTAVLARHLHLYDDSELRDVISGLVAAHPDARFVRIDGLPGHRAILAEAFRSAQRRILLASPYLAAAAMKADRVLTMVSNAVARGVDVSVYTGLTVSRDLEGKRAEALQRQLAAAGAQVHVTTRVHAKTLVVDDTLAVEGSFNWFAASRDPQWARKDSSVALRGSNAAAIIEQIEAEFAALRTTPITAPADPAYI